MSRPLSLALALATVALLAGCRTPAGSGLVNQNPTPGDLLTGGSAGIIAAGGGNIIASGGLNAAERASSPVASSGLVSAADFVPDAIGLALPRSLSASAYHVSASAFSMAAFLKGSIAAYTESAKLVDGILKGLKGAKLEFEKPYTFESEGQGTLTILVHKDGSEGLISIGRGAKADGAGQLIGIRYAPSTKKGLAVYRPDTSTDGLVAAAIAFDHKTQKATVDALSDTRALDVDDPQLGRAHWEFDGTVQGDRSFKLQLAVSANKTAGNSGSFGITAHFAKDASAAAICAIQPEKKAGLTWLPNDGNYAQNPIPHDYYVDAAGNDMAPGSAPATLKQLVPADDSLYQPFPAMPTAADPDTESVFRFPQ